MTMERVLGPMRRRLALMVSRAIVRLVDDEALMQALQVEGLAEELRDGVERVQDYGFTSVPHPGAEAVAVAVAGSRDHLVVVAVGDRRYRLRSLKAGEVAMYSDEGDSVIFRRGRVIDVVAGTKLRVTTPVLELVGDLTVSGSVTAQGDVVGQGTSLHTHVHGGVSTGTSTTEAPA